MSRVATATRVGRAHELADVLDEQLRRRLVETLARAQRLLRDAGDAASAGDEPEPEPDERHLGAAIAALVAQLEAAGEQDAASDQELHEQQLARLRQRFDDRVSALERVHGAIARLREITSPSAMLERAPRELSERSDLDRVVLSLVRDGVMSAAAVHVRGDPAGASTVLEALRANPIRLEHPLVETELLRRRRATVVTDAQVHPRVDRRMAEIMGWDSYLAAPVTVRSSVISVIHADRGPAGTLDVLQRDVLWEFAAGLAQAYESAGLRRTLRHERDQMRQFLEWLDARSGELSDAAIQLVPRPDPPRLPPPGPRDAAAARSGPDVAEFAGLLTRRELEVLRLLAEGRTNRAIADELVIANGTVKFHVNSILRKLHVANRAEAVARYFALRGMRPREP
jgi:DNA-binding CsgD family transcriptional regulator